MSFINLICLSQLTRPIKELFTISLKIFSLILVRYCQPHENRIRKKSSRKYRDENVLLKADKALSKIISFIILNKIQI